MIKKREIPLHRNRWIYTVVTAFILGVGLGSRSRFIDQTSFFGTYSGDTLWAMMVYFGLATILNRSAVIVVASAALVFAITIELSQLIQQPWINMLRGTRLGALVLGHGFLWSDLLCYSVGIILGAVIDKCIVSNQNPE